VIQNADGSFTRHSGVCGKAEVCFLTNTVSQPWLNVAGGGGKPVIQTPAQKESRRGTTIQETREGDVIKHTIRIASSSIRYDPAGDVSGYRFLVGYLTGNDQDVASVRMIPSVGTVEEDEVQDNTVLFLSEYTPPIIFEFYSPSHTLIATQLWDP